MLDQNGTALYSNTNNLHWLTIHIIALCVIACSVSGSLYIVVQTLRQWRRGPLKTTQKFPMWISLTDCLFATFHGIDHLYSLSTGHVLSGVACRAFGFGTVYSMNLPAFWVTVIAAYLWSLIVRNKTWNTGRGDYKIHIFCWGAPFLWNLIPLATDDFGQEPMWCGLPHRLFLFNGSVVLIAMILCSGFYGHLAYFLRTHQKLKREREFGGANSGARSNKAVEMGSKSTMNLPTFNIGGSERVPASAGVPMTSAPWRDVTSPKANATKNYPNTSEKKIDKLVRDLPVFLVIYLFQWGPYVIYAILLLAEMSFFALDVVVVTLTNAGGIANALAYRRFMLKDTARNNSDSVLYMKDASLEH